MPDREVTMLEIKEVLRLWLGGLGKKPIARQLGLDPKTVRRYLRTGLAWEQGPGALTEERLVAVLAALSATPQRPRGDTWALCQQHRAFLAALLEQRVRLTKVRKLLRRRLRAWIFSAVRSRHRFVYPCFQETIQHDNACRPIPRGWGWMWHRRNT